MKKIFSLFVLCWMFSTALAATAWEIIPDKSSIRFTATQK